MSELSKNDSFNDILADALAKQKEDDQKASEDLFPHERYTLTLRHEYVDSDGQRHSLDEPIVVSYSMMHMNEMPVSSSAIVINDMMERMRMFMIERVGI